MYKIKNNVSFTKKNIKTGIYIALGKVTLDFSKKRNKVRLCKYPYYSKEMKIKTVCF